MRIALFGATGAVGSTLLVHLLKGKDLLVGDQIVLVGRGTAESTARLTAIRADLLDAFDAGIVTIEVCPTLEELEAADVFVMAAGATIDATIKRRSDLAAKNVDLFQDVAQRLAQRLPCTFVLVISNPVELGVSVFCRYLERCRVIGMGAQQDSLRFSRAVSIHLDLPRAAVRASVLGEHGESMVPLWSSVYVVDAQHDDAARLGALRQKYERAPTETVVRGLRARVESMVANDQAGKAYELLEQTQPDAKIHLEPLITARVLSSTPNATANATLDCIAALRQGDGRKVHGQVMLAGEFYGLQGVLGAPISLQQSQWRIGTYNPLTEGELAQLMAANAKINALYESLLTVS